MCPLTAPDSFDFQVGEHVQVSVADMPSTNISEATFTLAAGHLPAALVNHGMRVYLFAKALAEQSKVAYVTDTDNIDLLFTACLLHEIGLATRYDDGPQRFEVEGANAAREHLCKLHVKEEYANVVWEAIALHTSPGIAENTSDLSWLVRTAVKFDFGPNEGWQDLKESLDEKYPRLDYERVLCEMVVAQAEKNPDKAPEASWPNNIYKAFLAVKKMRPY